MEEQAKTVMLDIKNKFLIEMLQDIKVGQIINKEWFKECTITDTVKGNLLEPETWIRSLTLQDSPFGYKNKTVVDQSVRLCKEISLKDCDPRLKHLAQQVVGPQYHCEPYKLVVYETGGFFKQHTDTAENNLVDTLVFHLPTDCNGGDLVFNDWNPHEYYAPTEINYVLFKINHPHRVTEVKKGIRVSLLFKVFEYESVDIRRADIKPFKNINCEMTICVPEMYKNVLMIYPDLEMLEAVLKRSKLNYIKVYFKNTKDTEVYDSYNSQENHADFEERMHFKDIVSEANSYRVQHLLDLGDPYPESASYYYYYGYTGNEACTREKMIRFHTGYLINPIKNESSSEEGSYNEDTDDDNEPKAKRFASDSLEVKKEVV